MDVKSIIAIHPRPNSLGDLRAASRAEDLEEAEHE